VMEISGTIAGEVRTFLENWENVQIKPDLQSIPRVAIAQKPTTDNRDPISRKGDET
jgi:hypothetical protein